jgi:DeoR/GlpR family transcriptional regulator of sugar metabolism
MNPILQYLEKHGERLDAEIAAATGISLSKVRLDVSELAANRQVMVCHSIKFDKGKQVENIICRLVGYIPPATPGRKSKAQVA